jgi:NADH-quinone oxidoreductase subunit N
MREYKYLDFFFFLNIEVFLGFSIIVFSLLIFFLDNFRNNQFVNLLNVYKHFILFIVFCSLLMVLNNSNIEYFFYGESYLSNRLINFFKVLVLLVLICMLLFLNYKNTQQIKFFIPYNIYEFFNLILLNIVGLFCFISAENFLLAYLGIELHSLSLSLLFASRYFTKYSTEAALKYFIISSFSSSLFLFGISFLYGIFGTIDFQNIFYLVFLSSNLFLSNIVITVAFILIIVSVLIKLGAAPFHMWSIDVYEGSPSFVTLYALTIPKIIYVGFFIKILFYFDYLNNFYNIQTLFLLFKYCGITSVIVGTIGALIETKVKRILAYSAIANFGYILLLLSVGIKGVLISLVFLVSYIIVTCNIFFILLTLISALDYSEITSIFEFKNLYNSGRKMIAFLLCISWFNLAGIPPMNIFISKFFLLYGIIREMHLNFYLLIFFIILSTIFSCFYYIRIIRLLFFMPINSKFYSIPFIKMTDTCNFIIAIFSILNLFLFFFPQLIFDFLEYNFFYGDDTYQLISFSCMCYFFKKHNKKFVEFFEKFGIIKNFFYWIIFFCWVNFLIIILIFSKFNFYSYIFFYADFFKNFNNIRYLN